MPSTGGGGSPEVVVSRTPEMQHSTIDDNGSNRDQRKIADSGDSVHSHRSATNSPLPPSGKGMGGRGPPGLGLPGVASTMGGGKADHLTLTPTSSLDGGGSDMYRQSSPFHGRDDCSELPPGLANLGVGSFDDDGGHDGLLGLQALGDHRPRSASRDSGRPLQRPPLSGGSGALNAGATDYIHGAISRPGESRYGQYGGSGDPHDQGLSRRRSISTDTGREFNHAAYAGGHVERHNSMDHLSQKFSNLSAVGPQSQQQFQSSQPSRPPTFQRHQRSISQPGPMGGQGAPDYEQHDNHYGMGTQQRYSASMDGGDYISGDRYASNQQYQQRRDGQGRSMSLSHGGNSMIQNSFEITPIRSQRRSSLQAMPNEFDAPPIHHRRASLQAPNSNAMYGQSRYAEGGNPIVASSEEMRMFSGSENERMGYPRHGERMVTPAHSPLHTNYGTHNRHPSDMGSSTMSSSPMSLGSGGVVSFRSVNIVRRHSVFWLTLSIFDKPPARSARATRGTASGCSLR